MKRWTPLYMTCAMALASASANAAVIYAGFGSSTVGETAPSGWTRVANTTGASSTITAQNYFAMNAQAGNTFSQFNSGSAVPRGAGQGFQLTSTFSATSSSGQFENTAFLFMTGSADTNGSRLIFNMGSANTGLLEFAGVSSLANGTMGATKYGELETAGAVYTLSLAGVFASNGSLSLTATVTNNIDATVVTSTATLNSVAAGNNYFGIRTASGGTGTPSASATHQSYLLESIPEPGTSALLLGSLGMLCLNRRRS